MSPLLATRSLSKHFGGVYATNDVTLKVEAYETHAIIGPNGAGKTTLIAQLAGTLRPDAGEIWFDGARITALSAHVRVARGLARSYQITSIFPAFSVRDNVLLAVLARNGSALRFWRALSAERELYAEAEAILSEVGLAAEADALAGELAHGQQRQLEIGLALATSPKLLLLDEPMAGMGQEESHAMLALLERLKPRLTLLLIEHDMDTVFRLADRVSVLVAGQIIASGTPQAIRAHPEVRAAYLGEEIA